MSDGKYNYDFILNEETIRRGDSSHAKLLQMVSPGATVLECGPADGIMTRYLKEVLNCRVYIIEIDSDCYAHAIQYADGGICVNLEDDAWMKQFADGFFDYILFADVLEHLHNPQAVLDKVKRLLKSDGSVLLSVPNVAHGDILMNLLCDRFRYTPLGLLDNTHIHFFAREDLHEMVCNAGYFLADESCTKVPLFATEQGVFIPYEIRAQLEQSLAEHRTRNVYQFVCRLVTTQTKMASNLELEAITAPESRFYFDLGGGFSDKHQYRIVAEAQGNGRLSYQIPLSEGCVAVRFDPVECQKCILRDTVAMVDGSLLESVPLNGLRVGSADFFYDEDPQLKLLLPSGGGILQLETTLIVLGTNGWREVAELIARVHSEMRQLLEKNQKVQDEKSQIERELSIFDSRLKSATSAQIRAESIAEKIKVQADILERQLIELTEVSAQQQKELIELTEVNVQQQKTMDALYLSTSWKLTKPLRAVGRVFFPKGRS